MKNAIIQFYHPFNGVGKDILKKHYPDEIPKWVEVSVNSVAEYAQHHGNIDSYCYASKFVQSSSNFFDKLRVYLDPSLDQYDQVLYLDCDVLVKDIRQNIFDKLTRDNYFDVAGVAEFPHHEYSVPVNWNVSKPLEDRFRHFGSRMVKATSNNGPYRMINSGVLLWSKEARLKARKQFLSHEEWFNYNNALLDSSLKNVGHSSHCLDQPFLNAMFNKFNFNVLELKTEWNRFPTKDEDVYCVFAHYVQDHRFRMPEIWEKLKLKD